MSKIKNYWLRFLGLQPKFSEATLLVMSLSFLILLYLDPRGIILDLLDVLELASHSRKGGNIFWYLLIMAVGLLVSLYHIVKKGEKSRLAAGTMLIFGIGMTAGTGILSGLYAWFNHAPWWALVLAGENLLYGILLFFTVDTGKPKQYIKRQDIKLDELLVGVLVVVGIIYIQKFKLHIYWPIVFSTCVAYATTVNSYLEKLIPHTHRKMPVLGFQMLFVDRLSERIAQWTSNHPTKTYFLILALIFVIPWSIVHILTPKPFIYQELKSIHITKNINLKEPSINFYYQGDNGSALYFESIQDFSLSVQSIIEHSISISFDTINVQEEALIQRSFDESWLGSFRAITLLFLTKYSQGESDYFFEPQNAGQFLASKKRRDEEYQYWKAIVDLYNYLEKQKARE